VGRGREVRAGGLPPLVAHRGAPGRQVRALPALDLARLQAIFHSMGLSKNVAVLQVSFHSKGVSEKNLSQVKCVHARCTCRLRQPEGVVVAHVPGGEGAAVMPP
jgi:hypothetical protein